MTTFAIVLVIFGLLIAVTRAPLIVAPGKTRDLILTLLESDTRMRSVGLIVAIFGAVCLWATTDVAGAVATVVAAIGVFALITGAVGMMLFPTWARDLGTRVWKSFPEPALRVLGVFAVVFGLWLAWYGFNL